MIDRDELAAWLRLLEAPGIGRQAVRLLLREFGSPQAVVSAPAASLRRRVGDASASALSSESADSSRLLAKTLAWIDAPVDETRDVLALGDARYPQSLLQTADPPLLVYVRGSVEPLNAASLAIVGSRNPTPQGLENARAFATHLSRSGLVVVSGLALGIDAAAHEGALDAAGTTIAVVGTGLDTVYPTRHRALADRIVQSGGAIVSEFAIGTPALPQNFPIRNRIIAGLARGTLVVEAAVQSGSLITARLALESGRDVFAIPGSIHSPQARGCNALIKQGAKLVDAAADILEEYGVLVQPVASGRDIEAQADAGREDPLVEALGFDPIGLDALVARTGMGAAELSARLLELELAGRVARLPGQLFQRIERA
ncbi:MAG TPA: DNA-processing protein DprA [Caldimonas sp.]|nr:DNA-processing protein DprA [Caldimonas sp.]